MLQIFETLLQEEIKDRKIVPKTFIFIIKFVRINREKDTFLDMLVQHHIKHTVVMSSSLTIAYL